MTKTKSGFEILKQKQFPDGSRLELLTWISDRVKPNERTYQLSFWDDKEKPYKIFPLNCWDYTKEQIEQTYDSVKRKSDFDKLLNSK